MRATVPETSTTETSTTSVFGVWPSEAPPAQHGTDEAELVTRLQARDEAAFREIVDRFGSKVYQVCYGILGNRDDADETAQEVFAKVHFGIRGFGGRSSLYSWIYRITLNECYGFLRKKRVRRFASNESSGEMATGKLEAVADERPTPDRIALQRDFLNKLLAQIPKRDRWLLLSKEVEGCSVAELSQRTGLTVNAIKARLFRARRDLLAAAYGSRVS